MWGICMENLLKVKISDKSRRPIFTMGEYKLECLLDTGADMCVFTCGSDDLLKCFPKAVLVENVKALISGFGDGVDIAEVYKIPEIIIHDSWSKENLLRFENVLVACCTKDINVQMILAAPLFGNINYRIINKDENGKQVWLEYDRDIQYVVPVMFEEDKSILESISVFSQ